MAENLPSLRTLRIFAGLPFFIRRAMYWNRPFHDPFRIKRTTGTVSVTSVEMLGKVSGGSSWGIPVEFHPLTGAFRAITRKPAMVGDRVEARELLGVTIVFDHDVVDGADHYSALGNSDNLSRLHAGPPRSSGLECFKSPLDNPSQRDAARSA